MKIRISPLDSLFSEFIRKRALLTGGCEYCGQFKSYAQLQCSHFIGRRKRSTRYDPDNAAGVCFSCHSYLGEHPYEHTEWFKKRLGDRFEQLIIKGNTPMKVDKEALTLYFKEKLKGIE